MLQLRLILGLGLEQELRKTLESRALLGSIAWMRRDDPRNPSSFRLHLSGARLCFGATRDLTAAWFPPAGTLPSS